ncbi:MAG: lysylphosphatidylglycerol synthase transmembrane domain-containing protein [Candidatus Hodarchaeales archaeon]
MALSDKSVQSKIFTFRNFVFGMILGGVVYLILILVSNWEQLFDYLGMIPVEIILIAMGLSFLNYLCRFVKWLLFTKSLQLKIPLLYNFKVFMAGLALAITPAKAGEAIRAVLLKKGSDIDLSKGLASTFSERLIDLLAVTIISIVGIIVMGFESDYLIILLAIFSFVVVGIIIFLSNHLYRIFSKVFFLGPWKKMGNYIDNFRSDVVITFQLPVFGGALVFGIIGWTCECLAFMLIAHSLGISMTFQMAMFIYATSSIIGAISFLPGGLGLMEGGLSFLVIDLLSVTYTQSVALTLVIRFTTLWFGVGVGLAFLLWITREFTNGPVNSNL